VDVNKKIDSDLRFSLAVIIDEVYGNHPGLEAVPLDGKSVSELVEILRKLFGLYPFVAQDDKDDIEMVLKEAEEFMKSRPCDTCVR
jgi:hypothetical protein